MTFIKNHVEYLSSIKFQSVVIFMAQKKKKNDEKHIFTLYLNDGSFPEMTSKVTLKKSRPKKKRDVKQELENTRMDMIQ